MNLESLQSNWAIWLALLAVLVAVVALAPKLLRKTSSAKLKRVVADMQQARKDLRKTVRGTLKAEKKLEKLTKHAERVKPRVLQEAKEAVEDAQALRKILNDKVLVTENHVRRVIHDEFPPTAHDRLRRKYLPKDIEDNRPFSF